MSADIQDDVRAAMDGLRTNPEYLIKTILTNNLPAVCERLRTFYNRSCTSAEDVMVNVRDLVKGYPASAIEILSNCFSVPIEIENLTPVGEDAVLNYLIQDENAATTR